MSSLPTYTRWPVSSALRYFFWLHPEWWSRALCFLAWAVLLFQGWQHAGHEVRHRMTFAQEFACWMLMAAAMMLPLVLHRVWVTAASSLWARRHRAIAGFLGGYFVPWVVLGIAIAAMQQGSWTHNYWLAALGFVAAALWQLTPIHSRALAECHRTVPLAPLGWRAHRDCFRFGVNIGIACVWSCWPLMMACAFAGHGLVAITGGTLVGVRSSLRPRALSAVLGTLAIASYYLVLMFVDPRNGV